MTRSALKIMGIEGCPTYPPFNARFLPLEIAGLVKEGMMVVKITPQSGLISWALWAPEIFHMKNNRGGRFVKFLVGGFMRCGSLLYGKIIRLST